MPAGPIPLGGLEWVAELGWLGAFSALLDEPPLFERNLSFGLNVWAFRVSLWHP